jgi:hypothetical protein
MNFPLFNQLLTEAKIELNPDEVIGILNHEFLPNVGDRDGWEPITETIGIGSDVNPKKAAKEYIKILETQREWQRDLKGMAKYVNLNPWKKWTDDDIETSPFFDPWIDDIPRQKKEFQKFKRHMTAFINEVKKLL